MEKASPQLQKTADSPMELEHAVGISGKIVRAVYLHPNTKEFVYISGCSIVICDLMDPHKQFFLRGHDDQITCLTISNDGKLIASGQKGDNSDVIIWDYEYKKAKFRLSEHDYEIVCVEFSHDDKLLFSCGNSMDKRIFIWDTSNGYIVGSVPMLPESINSMKWGGFVKDIKGRDTTKYQFATSGQKVIYLWKLDAKTGTFEQEFINTGSTIRQYLCLSFSKNREDYLFAGTSSGDFCAFQIKNKLLSSITNVCALGITSVLSVTPELLAVGGGDGTVATFHVDGHVITALAKVSLPGAVNSISCSLDGVQLLTSTDRGFVHRIKSSDLTTVLQCENHTDSVVFIAYPDGISDKFASCSEDGTIRRWDVNDYIVEGRCVGTSAGSPLCLVYADEVLLSGWEDGRIRMFRNDKNTQVWQIDNAHKGGVPTIALASNLKFLCSGGAEGGVRVWEMRSREMVSHLKEHTNRVTKVKLFDDDLHLLSSSRDKALLCWDLRNEKRISAHIQRMGGINSFDIIPGKNIVLTTGQDRKITYWDLREANPVKSYDTNSNPKKGDECMSLAISHDGKYFATGGSEQVVRLWDLAAGKVLAEGTGHSGCINTVAFSADDKQLVSGGRDGSILVWNLYL